MSAPYWGKLPAPAPAAGPARQDRYSGDYIAADDDQPRQRPQRISVQTTNTEAPTDSTFSPFGSPTASSFLGQGLAPRPPSYQHSTPDYPPDIADRRTHRRTRTNDSFEPPTLAPPPAVPEVPTSRGPPLSYRGGRWSNSSTPDPYAAAAATAAAAASVSRAPRAAASPPVVAMDRARDPQYARPPRDDQRDYFTADHHTQEDVDPGASPRPRIAGEVPLQQVRKGSVREVTTTGRSFPLDPASNQPRRASASAASTADRRRKFADDRSPLQRLELTLDTMTKEEKRAKVEAAERRARERAARNAESAMKTPPGAQKQPQQQQLQKQLQPQQQLQPPQQQSQLQPQQQQQVRFRERSASHGIPVEDQPTPSRRPSARAEPPVAAHRGPLSQNPPEEPNPYHDPGQSRLVAAHPHPPAGPVAPAPALTRAFDPAPAVAPEETAQKHSESGNMGLPKRNLSFRERAARQDMRAPNGLESESPTTPPAAPPQSSGGFSLTRNGSNKLRKDPPGDPWYRLRLEAENAMRSHPQPQPQPQPSNPMNEHSTRGPSPKMNPPQSHHEEALAPAPEVRRTRPEPQVLNHTTYTGPPVPQPQPGIMRHATEPIPSTTQTTVTFDDEPHILAAPATNRDSPESDPDHRPEFTPGDGLYLPPKYLDEWRQATIGSLGGALLDLHENDAAPQPTADKGKAWWESGPRKRSISSRPRKAEAFDGEYAETNGPTRFKPSLYLECGPLLRYCGIRRELAAKSVRDATIVERQIWKGSIMIVTRDEESDYAIAPTLRLFVQPLELLAPHPVEVNGDLPPEYVDPIAGHPKVGRKGETVYVRPVEHLEEGMDLSRSETDEGLYEAVRSPPDVALPEGVTELPGSYASRHKRIEVDGEKVSKYKDVRGFRLHAERGHTFWRFNVEVELATKQQRVAYRINRGPSQGFWVPAKGTPMNIMYHSCNGFGLNVDTPDDLSGPDPLWRDVLNTHQTQPFHVMVGGGGQIFNDSVMDDCALFRRWSSMRDDAQRYDAPFVPELQEELERFYLRRYCEWFSQGLFSLATSQIPMVNMWDDHEIMDGYGSYARRVNGSPVFCGLGAVAFKYYMLFQHQSIVDETEESEPSWIQGVNRGRYIGEQSRSLLVDLGADVSLLAVDCRTERTELDVVAEATWEKILDRCYKDVKTGTTKHLLVVLPVPVAYPRLDWLEKTMGSRLMTPFKRLGRSGVLGNKLHQLEGDGDIRDDLGDHWTAKNRKGERQDVVEQLQDLAAIKSARVTILSGHVNLTAVGQFYSHPRFNLPKHKDFRYMPNITASPIVNRPAPNLMVDMLNKRNKIHHFDKDTDEAMIPLFAAGVDGRPRNNKRMLPHRNWCSIRAWAPGNTPPGTPAPSVDERTPSPPPGRAGSLFRRFSRRKGGSLGRQDSVQDVPRPPVSASARDVSRPPVSASLSSGGFFRSLSRRNSDVSRPPPVRPGKLARSLSVDRARRMVGLGKPAPQPPYQEQDQYDVPDTNGNGYGHAPGHGQQWVEETEPYSYYDQSPDPPRSRLRGGADREYEEGDEAAFTARPVQPPNPNADSAEFRPKTFHRTPTGLSTKQRKRADEFAVDLEGGLDVCINVEVNPRDPTGITVPYRLLVPRLFHDEEDEKKHDEVLAAEVPRKGFKRFLSFKGKGSVSQGQTSAQSQVEMHEEPQPLEEQVEEVPREEFASYKEQRAPQPQPQLRQQQPYAPEPEHYDRAPQPRPRQQIPPGSQYPSHGTPQPRRRQQYTPEPLYYNNEWR